MIYYTSDTHFYHNNIIKYCNRPFDSVAVMNEELIDRWNSVVTNKDVVYHLGDFGMASSKDIDDVAKRLNGREKYIILGNHDKRAPATFTRKEQVTKVIDEGITFYLCHYSMRVWPSSHRNTTYQLYGHSHGNLPGIPGMSLDVGTDCWDYYPINKDQILQRLGGIL